VQDGRFVEVEVIHAKSAVLGRAHALFEGQLGLAPVEQVEQGTVLHELGHHHELFGRLFDAHPHEQQHVRVQQLATGSTQ
jgi:hypothetical protein